MNRLARNIIVGVAVTLLGQGGAHPSFAEWSESRLSIVYTPPLLSMEAKGIALPELLQAIGAEVGFQVVAPRGNHLPGTVSIADAPLDAVLRQLLHGESYAITYRDPGEAAGREIEMIVLVRPPSAEEAISEPGEQGAGQDLAESLQSQEELPPVLEAFPGNPSSPALAGEWEQTRGWGIEKDEAEVQVEAMLWSHALTAWPGTSPFAGPPGSSRAGPPTGIGPSETNLRDLDETLALTTRRAQENLQALMEALTTATDSLLGSAGEQGR